MKKPVSIKLEPGDVALVLGTSDGDLTLQTVTTPEVDALYETEEDEIELPLNVALAVALENRIQKDDTFMDEVIGWNLEDAEIRKKVVTLEPGQVAIVLGDVDGQISRQLFTTPDIDKLFDGDEDEDKEVEVPAHFDLAYAIMMRLETEEDFRKEMFDWLDRRRDAAEEEA